MTSTKRKILHCGWLTDIHLEFLTNKEAAAFVESLAYKGLGCLWITGDISTAHQIEDHLQLFEKLYKTPVYFVLGNHDYYGGDIESVRSIVKKKCQRSKWLHWLPSSGIVPLNNDTCLIGHDGWSDGRLGNYKDSKVLLNDYLKIQDFVQAGGVGRLALLNRLGDQAASYIRGRLLVALEQYSHIIILTHVPPFIEACWHEGEISTDDWLPHFSCQAMGDVLKGSMRTAHDKQMTVFCGHTHSFGECQILPNLLVKTGEAKYGAPKIQEIFKISY
ncbi:metallophosphoesterase [Desulfopila sp. IMCC35008]|uniref:metallophosphoesterase n=1 Tax=Desulfopila sp. IMCC35008 TaxID=2653858 RepID=UPI0013D58EE9|nr:metallophosphoesterase [Desulfopila sp. IMCC35008]